MKRWYLFFVWFFLLNFILFLEGCSDDESNISESVMRYPIRLESAIEFSFSELFDTIEYVPLASEGVLLGDIFSIKVFGKYIGVVDDPGFTFARLTVFDRKGALMGIIELQESGPERLININDFWINETDGRVFVLDLVQQKVVEYRLDGHFVRYFYTPAPCSQFVMVSQNGEKGWFYFDNRPMITSCEEGLFMAKDVSCIKKEGTEYLYNEDQLYNVRYVDLVTCEMYGGAPIRPSLLFRRLGYPFFSNYTKRSQYFYHNWFCDTIYSFAANDPRSFRPFVSFDFGRHSFTKSDEARFVSIENEGEKLNFLNKVAYDKVRYFRHLGNAGGRLWVRFGCKRTPYLISLPLNDLRGEPILYRNEPHFSPNNWDLMSLPPMESAYTEDYFVFKIPAYMVKDLVLESGKSARNLPSEDKRRIRFERVKKILNSVDRDDNPVLVFAHLKDVYSD